jgi:hypothetical protein
MSLRILSISLLAILSAWSCDNLNPDQKRQTAAARSDGTNDAVVESLIKKYKDNPQQANAVGRYQVFVSGATILKLDTATGQTWALKESRWEPLATEPVQEGNPVPVGPPSSHRGKKSLDEIFNSK